ncbi:acyltransferase family protein [Propionicimonas sp.]|uniref:acyltransferase family protein n=1 Tax=Propionicimonas sp. TaxID=1955623 RepID=UPI001D27116B|nr:acyltransferase family protein [Propionicimonas sp.]MBU3976366.1 acyltransferase [Actinomycetota bacterium]MBU3987523.1 acyltransferase [Actinomycetota bacterium]MBU4006532.1 acyltransferase [Actinomycetota bacterium]MBU4065137.1 acyltransferase [Actinomycetota bacterium]MBU4092225.1 acyltransferase [Actinomycetota bacterium]
MRKTLTEVQALRAIAVAAVVIYHIAPRLLPGGFVGVDVFFVISGFLITRHMLAEVAERGTLSLAHFWANRARRILPASLLVIVVTAAVVGFTFPIEEIRRNGDQGLAATWYFQNWALAGESVDYLAADNVPTPFQHFWSLSVEEQFYLVWPIILVGAAWLIIRLRRDAESAPTATERTQRWIGTAFAVLVASSFLYSVLQVSDGDATAYFSSIGRLWELGLGGVLAAFYRDPVARPRLRAAIALLGYLLIALACWRLNGDTPFPGFAALLPVGGAALIIAAGRTSGLASLTQLIEWRPIQAVGDWSYSIYLWHFGFVVGATTIWQTTRFPWWLKAGIVTATLVAAYLSYRYVEQPFRARRWAVAAPRKVLGLAAAGLVVTSLVCLALPLRVLATEADWAHRADSVKEQAASYRPALDTFGPLPAFPAGFPAMTPDPLRAAADRPAEAMLAVPAPGADPHQCQARVDALTTPLCLAGDPSSAVRVVLVGDSHANVMITPLSVIAAQRHWRLEVYTHASCPFNATTRGKETKNLIKCRQANTELLNKLLADPPELLISVAWSKIDWVGLKQDPQAGVRGYVEYWRKLAQAGIPVVAFRDTPSPIPTVMRCMTANYERPETCAAPVGKALAENDEVGEAAAQVPGTRVVGLDKQMCTDKVCPTVINHILIYRDTNHITRTWALALTPAIAAQLPPVAAG